MNDQLCLLQLDITQATQSILDLLPFGVLLLDRDLCILSINAFLRQRLPGQLPGGNKTPVGRILGAHSQQTIQSLRQVLESGQPATLSTRFHRSVFRLQPLPGMPFADEVPQSVTILPVMQGWQVSSLLVVVQDVSERLLAESELKRQIDKLSFLHEFDLALSTLDLDTCMKTLVTRLRALFAADFVALFLSRNERLEIVASDGLQLGNPFFAIDSSHGITSWVLQHAQGVLVTDVQRDPRYLPLFDSIRSEMAAPLIAHDQCLGVIDLESNSPAAFSHIDLKLLEMAAFSSANAIHNAQVHSELMFAQHQLRVVNDRLENMLRVSQVLSQNLPKQNIPQVTVEVLAQMLHADCVTITRFNEQEQAFRVLAAHGASQRFLREFHTPQPQALEIIRRYGNMGVIYHLTETLNTVNVPIYQEDQLHGLMYALIEYQGKTIGSLNVFSRDPQRCFSAEEKDLLRALTPSIGLAMENARLYDELINLATTDGLTGLANRRQMDDLLTAEIERSKRYQHNLSVLMIDLDHFKCYNDTFGHALGDELLQKIARLFKHCLRVGDTPARYGGDEFVVVLPETNAQGALRITDRLKNAVAGIASPKVEGRDCQPFTLSIGIASFPQHADTAAALLRCADQALYRAKQLGRNRVEVFKQAIGGYDEENIDH